jgi:hypothetical protein
VPFATQVAYGRPDACPEDAVDPYGDGTPSPMDLRCSYTDGTGAVLTRVHGRVLFEGPPGSPGESAGRVTVVLHRAPRALGQPLGPELARVVTEPQGTFTLGAMLRAGELVLVVADPDGGPPLLQQRIVVGGDAGHHLADVRLVIPRPLDDEAFPSEPAAEASEPAAFPSEPAPRPQP